MTLPTFRYSFYHKHNHNKDKDKENNEQSKLTPNDLQDLHDDLDDIYNNYTSTANSNNDSVDTLDSENNQAENHFIYKPPVQPQSSQPLPVVHISSRLSSLGNDTTELGESIAKSAPGTPLSTNSFDFRPHYPRAVTNSSLNVLLDSPNASTDFNHLVDHTPPRGNDDDDDDDDGVPRSAELKENEENWEKKGSASKTIKTSEGETRVIRRSVTDFKFGKELGEGSYSTVILATDKINAKQYAVKVLDKRHIIKEKKVKYVNIEKHALNRLSNRLGVISLYFTFQDKDSLYFVLDYASNGELLSLIKKHNTLNEDATRHFGAQILDAIKYMHDNGVIHRDLKPENILLDDKMRIQITDFGTARLLEKKNDESEDYPLDVRAKSFVGTAEYVSPELLESKYCGKPGDIWAFGCIIYQMIAGKPPFKATNEYLTFQKITKLQYAFSAGFPTVIRDLIKKILVLQPSRRATIPEIQKHYFFQSVDFDDFDQLWLVDPPEIGPYKMSAKSMMKIPELNKSQNTGHHVAKKKAKKPHTQTQAPLQASAPPTPGSSTNGSSPTPERGLPTANTNKSSEKAFVLNKPQTNSDSSVSDNSPKNSSSSDSREVSKKSSHSQPNYIPGTNILRPQINTRPTVGSYVRSAPTRKPKPKPKPKVMEVTPLTTLEAAWESYLHHPDERVIRIGPVIVHKEATEPFERKNKASLHASPLTIQGHGRRTRSNTSLLTQLVNEVSNNSQDLKDIENADESEAIIEPQYSMKRSSTVTSSSGKKSVDLERSSSTSGSKITKKTFFKKLGFSHYDKNDDEENQPIPSLTDKPQTCTMVITTHGRALIFTRDDNEASYVLLVEVKLKYPFIHFQELVSPQNKFSKLLPTVGIFVISSVNTSLIFEVETYEVNQWTEALAKSKSNEIERLKLEDWEKEQAASKKEPSPSQTQTQQPKRQSNSAHSSPKLLDAPAFERSKQQTGRKSVDLYSTTSPPQSPRESHSHSHSRATHMLRSKLQSPGLKRKPPPVSPPSELNVHTGLPHKSNETGMLHAAQLAVSQNAQASVYPNHRRSSFTKDDGTKIDHSKPHTNGNQQSPGVTTLNSRFLARSTRKK
ncbi:PKH2 Serine/threonine-protein kinase PKH2 [Candida maltosa Xu316]